VLLSGDEDDDIQQFFIKKAFPREELVAEILQALEASDAGLTKSQLYSQVNGTQGKTEAAVRFLCSESPAPVVIASQGPIRYARTTVPYQLPHEHIERLSQQKTAEWTVMQDYVHHDGCLMGFLSEQLDDPNAGPCGKCSSCDPKSALSEGYRQQTAHSAVEFLGNVFIEILPRKRVNAADFPIYNFPTALASEGLEFETGRALCRWGEAGWGEIAKAGKKAGLFDPRLAVASAALMQDRWNPDPFPAWVTFVPSHRNAELVGNFAQQLADELGIPCIDVVSKVRKNDQQKRKQNTSFRCANLDGVFEIAPGVSDEPVLLVDDAVDSKWTFTVIAALLRRAGSGPVYPFAIMDTSSSE
jgi:ATP-dependent DNA helicase RecQ